MGSGGNRRRHWEVEGEGRPKQEETLGGGLANRRRHREGWGRNTEKWGEQEETLRRGGLGNLTRTGHTEAKRNRNK